MSREVVYIGGPLDGEATRKVGDHWPHFRDDAGQPLPRDVGDAEFAGGVGPERGATLTRPGRRSTSQSEPNPVF